MKSLDKNQDKQETVALHAAVISMQTHLTAACLKQGLKISTTISQNDGDVPVLSYAIAFNTDEPVVFTGQARSAQEPHYQTMFELIHGRMVSEIFPPTIRTVKQDTDEGSNDPVEVPISYWKRRLVIEHDITVRDPDPKASQSDGLHMLARKSVWVGYNTKSEEIIRVDEGSANFAPETVERVQYMELGPRGVVVIVIYKDTVRLVQGQQGTFAEALKTAQAGFEPAGATSAGATLSSAPTVSLSSLGASASTAASSGGIAPIGTISNLDLGGMSLKNKSSIDKDSALGQAVERIAVRGRRMRSIDVPKSIRASELYKLLGVTDEKLAISTMERAGKSKPSLKSVLNQDQAVHVVTAFGFKAVRLTEGGSAETSKAPAVKKTAKATPATKRVSRAKKPQSND